MSRQLTPAETVRVFTEAWTSGDMDAAASYVADDVVFDGPLGHVDGRQAYMDGLRGLAQIFKSVKILAAYGDDTQALIMYEAPTDSYGTLTCAKLFTLRGGKIVSDRLTFDATEMRQARGG